jgi:hypothetical protein
MDAMILSTKANKDVQNRLTQDFIVQLKNNYPQFSFREGRHEHWSPTTKTITYNLNQPAQQLYFGLLHELAHALLGHLTYHGDFELLKLESEAWGLAVDLAKDYGLKIEDDHVQNCLDTYRDWLHRRSSCPQCGAHVLQRDVSTYQCFNCQTRWHVSSGRFVRPYRKMLKI